jgi:hypothetical protein
MNSSDKSFETRARGLYLEASRRLDPVTAGRLRAARRTALEAAQAPAAHHHRARVLLPVGALAAVALAALIIWQPGPQPQTEAAQPATAGANHANEQDNELPPGADNTDPGMYQNLDFYGWLATNESSQAKN